MTIPYTEAQLVVALQQGNSTAFSQLYTQYQKALLRAIVRIIKDPVEAEDLLQDTYLKVWQRFESYNVQQGALYTWLVRIAHNTALDALRKRKVYLSFDQAVDKRHLSINWEDVTNGIGVQYVVQQMLPASYWRVVDLAYWQGYTRQEIADQLGIPIGTVKTRLRQSVLSLKPLFQ